MNKRIITEELIIWYENCLRNDEKCEATIEKYMRDIRGFAEFAGDRHVEKQLVIEYKTKLGKEYAVASANSMLAALNGFFKFAGWYDCCVKRFRVQQQLFWPEEKELTRKEFFRLINAAKLNGNKRLDMILQTIGGTGIRVSELQYITVEAVMKGEAVVECKGRTRTVFLVTKLRKKLLKYIRNNGLESGPVFLSRSGKPVSRINIWREMKKLCESADVMPEKVFPHNLRHLFARLFYEIEKDIAKLADILGHASINTTRIYVVTTKQEHQRKMEAMKLIL